MSARAVTPLSVVLVHHLYAVLANRTMVDRELLKLRKAGTVRVFPIGTGAGELVVCFTHDFLEQVRDPNRNNAAALSDSVLRSAASSGNGGGGGGSGGGGGGGGGSGHGAVATGATGPGAAPYVRSYEASAVRTSTFVAGPQGNRIPGAASSAVGGAVRRSSRRVPPYSSSAATAQQHPARRHRPIGPSRFSLSSAHRRGVWPSHSGRATVRKTPSWPRSWPNFSLV